MTINLRRASREERGFTLTEIAIVLGIIGLILGAIWAAASAVYTNMKTSESERGIIATAQAVRSMFANSSKTGAASAGATITVPGMFPVSWQQTTGAVTTYGDPFAPASAGTFAYVLGDSGNLTDFGIELDGVSAAGCTALLNYFAAAASSVNGGTVTGLIGVKLVTGAPVSGAASAGSAAVIGWAAALPTSCVTTSPATAGTSGDNNVAIWFSMSNM